MSTPQFCELIIDSEHPALEVEGAWLDTLQALAQEVIETELGQTAEVSLVLVDDPRIQELNKEYRDKDVSTDVLSFPMYEFAQPGELIEGEPEEGGALLLGDIIISLDTAIRQADDYGHSLQREISFLFLHGLLHLVGYDHEEEEDKKLMRQQEERYLAGHGLARQEDSSDEE